MAALKPMDLNLLTIDAARSAVQERTSSAVALAEASRVINPRRFDALMETLLTESGNFVIDTGANKVIATITVGANPNDMVLSRDGLDALRNIHGLVFVLWIFLDQVIDELHGDADVTFRTAVEHNDFHEDLLK